MLAVDEEVSPFNAIGSLLNARRDVARYVGQMVSNPGFLAEKEVRRPVTPQLLKTSSVGAGSGPACGANPTGRPVL